MATVRFMRVSNLEGMQRAKCCASESGTISSQIYHYISVRNVKEMKDTSGTTDGNLFV